MPGRRQEEAGVIRHGASLLRAFAGATVPKLTVVLRKAFGGAAITMNSKDLGADVVFSWPGAQIGIMAARQAVGIVHRRALRRGGRTVPRRARRGLRRRAPDRAGRRRQRLGRRGDRPGAEPRSAGLGAALAGGTMSVFELGADRAGAPARARVVSTYVALGDSFTAGRDSADGERWADQLAAALRGRQPRPRLPQPRRRRRHQRRRAGAGAGGAGAEARPGHGHLRRQRRPADLPARRRGLRTALRRDPRPAAEPSWAPGRRS